MHWLFVAILIAALLHVIEEYAWPGGFPAFMRRMAPRFATGITTRFATVINGAFLLLCVAAALLWPQAAVFCLSVAALLVVNGLTHIGGSLRARAYAPGLITGALLYIPLGVYAFYLALSRGLVGSQGILFAALLGVGYALTPIVSLALRRRET
jgi:membrane-bound metal-dependent hydrolase YbcI (DUF457 family)